MLSIVVTAMINPYLTNYHNQKIQHNLSTVVQSFIVTQDKIIVQGAQNGRSTIEVPLTWKLKQHMHHKQCKKNCKTANYIKIYKFAATNNFT